MCLLVVYQKCTGSAVLFIGGKKPQKTKKHIVEEVGTHMIGVFGIVRRPHGRLCPLLFLRDSGGVILCVTPVVPLPSNCLRLLHVKLLFGLLCVSLSPLPICYSSHERKEYWVNIHKTPYMSSELNPT